MMRQQPAEDKMKLKEGAESPYITRYFALEGEANRWLLDCLERGYILHHTSTERGEHIYHIVRYAPDIAQRTIAACNSVIKPVVIKEV